MIHIGAPSYDAYMGVRVYMISICPYRHIDIIYACMPPYDAYRPLPYRYHIWRMPACIYAHHMRRAICAGMSAWGAIARRAMAPCVPHIGMRPALSRAICAMRASMRHSAYAHTRRFSHIASDGRRSVLSALCLWLWFGIGRIEICDCAASQATVSPASV